jgi:hypothetical protein
MKSSPCRVEYGKVWFLDALNTTLMETMSLFSVIVRFSTEHVIVLLLASAELAKLAFDILVSSLLEEYMQYSCSCDMTSSCICIVIKVFSGVDVYAMINGTTLLGAILVIKKNVAGALPLFNSGKYVFGVSTCDTHNSTEISL